MTVQLEDLIARLRLDSSGLSSGLSSASSSLDRAGAQASRTGRSMSTGITLPLAAAGFAAVKLAGSFDQTMRQVSIATDGSTESLSKLAMQMGADTAFSAGEAADAMLELAKGGMSAAQIEGGALAATMKLASAGNIALGDSSTYVSNAMAAFGLKAKDADSIAVALAGAANASSASVESLGMALAQGSGAARNAGMSLQETVGTLSLFDANALKGSDAGTSLKSMLNSLIPTTTKATGAMEKLGLDFVKGNGEFESMANIAGQLKTKLGGLTEAERSLALETIFGSDGMRAATALMNEGSEGVKKYTAAAKDQETTTKLANSAMEGVSGALERAQGSMETAALTLGAVLAPHVERVAGWVELLANKFTELPASVKSGIVIFGALAAVIGPLLVMFGFIATGLAGIAAAAAAVSLPVIAVVGGLVLLGAALVVAYQRSEAFRAAVGTAFAAVALFVTTSVVPAALRIRDAFVQMYAVVAPIVRQIMAVFAAHMPAIQATVQQVFNTVKVVVMGAMTIVLEVIRRVTSTVQVLWGVFGGTILATINRVFPAILQVIRGTMQVIRGIVQTITSAIRGDWSGVWNGLKNIASGVMTALGGIVRAGMAVIRGIVGALGAALSALFSAAFGAARERVAAGINAIVQLASGIKGRILGALSGAGTWLVGIGANIVQGLGAGIDSMYQWVRDKVNALSGWIPGWVKKALGIASPSKVMAELGKWIGKGLVEGLIGTREEIGQTMTKLTDKLREANRKGLAAAAAESGRALQVVAAKYTTVGGQLDKQIEKLKQLKDDAASLAAQIVSTFQDTGSLTNIRGQTDAEGNELPITAADVVAAKSAAAARATEFRQVLQQLRTAGLSQPQLLELANAGPAALEVARATLAGGAEAIRALNAYTSHITAQGKVVGEIAQKEMCAAGISATEGLIQGLEAQQDRVAATMERMAKRLVRTLRTALKMKSPSRVMFGLGDDTGAGYALGITSTVRQVERASARLASAAQIAPQGLQMGAGSLSASATRATSSAAPAVQLHARVFVGDREITDIVNTEIGSSLAPLQTLVRQGA